MLRSIVISTQSFGEIIVLCMHMHIFFPLSEKPLWFIHQLTHDEIMSSLLYFHHHYPIITSGCKDMNECDFIRRWPRRCTCLRVSTYRTVAPHIFSLSCVYCLFYFIYFYTSCFTVTYLTTACGFDWVLLVCSLSGVMPFFRIIALLLKYYISRLYIVNVQSLGTCPLLHCTKYCTKYFVCFGVRCCSRQRSNGSYRAYVFYMSDVWRPLTSMVSGRVTQLS